MGINSLESISKSFDIDSSGNYALILVNYQHCNFLFGSTEKFQLVMKLYDLVIYGIGCSILLPDSCHGI